MHLYMLACDLRVVMLLGIVFWIADYVANVLWGCVQIADQRRVKKEEKK